MAQRSESLPDPLQSPESNPELVAKGEQQAQAAVKAAGLTPDEVETVAVEAPSGPVEMPKADTPLVVAEYTTDEALLKDYADLLTGQRQRTFAFAMCVVDLVLAVMVVVTWPSLWIVAVALVALAVAMMIWRRHASANVAKRLLKGLDKADLHRVVSVYGDHVVLTKSDGTPHRYDRKDLSELKHNDTIGVLVFGNLGVTVPRGALSEEDWQKLLAWGGDASASAAADEKTERRRAELDLEEESSPEQDH